MYANALDLAVNQVDLVRPPREISVSQCAHETRRVYEVGAWDNNIAPYMIEPMDMLNSDVHTGLSFMGPARSLKTDSLVMNWQQHIALFDPSDFMLVNMSMGTCRDYVKKDIRRWIEGNLEVKNKLLPGKQNDNLREKVWANGTVFIYGWATVSQLASKTIRRCAITDYDRFPLDIGGEGNLFALTQKRNQTFNAGVLKNGMTMAESSPGHMYTEKDYKNKATPHIAPPAPGIASLYNDGDRRLWYWQCKNDTCKKYAPAEFNNLEWDDTPDHEAAGRSARYICPHCKHEHTSGERYSLNQKGKWLSEGLKINSKGEISGQARESSMVSYWLEGVAACFQQWSELVTKYLKAKEKFEDTGDYQDLKVTVNVDQGKPFCKPIGEDETTADQLQEQAKDFAKNKVPKGVRYLIGTVDIQNGSKGRFVCQVMGFAYDGKKYIIDRFDIRHPVDPETGEISERRVMPESAPEDWDQLEHQFMNKQYELDDDSGRKMGLKLVLSDLGGTGATTDNAYKFYRRLKKKGMHRDFMLVKGRKQIPLVKVSYPDNTNRKDRTADARGEIPILTINTNRFKDMISASLIRVDDEADLVLPDWLPFWFFKELTAETSINGEWKCPKGTPNEATDLCVYALAGSYSDKVKADKINWSDPPAWADDWDNNSHVTGNTNTPKKRKRLTAAQLAALNA
ncbi:terminase gpA endonuclease subunit [Marinicellulosiphila megalodicopiae]|uniref:terminase gpA endonuclease subunit n=1 Tax=Marinicellulosiphila megalodicopiae TaxID=2724896 RepID=UPI003BAE52FF